MVSEQVCFWQIVVLIGSSASAVDISRDIAGVAKEVHIAARTIVDGTFGKQAGYDNMWLHPMVKSFPMVTIGWLL